jgi:transposase
MEYIGIDVHKRDSQVCIITQKGEVLEQRIRTERKSFAELFGKRARARILVEASTESEWVARCLEGLGHEVVVGDPNFAPMYASRDRRVKTDRRDARALAEACRLRAYRPAHRISDRQHHVRVRLAVREALVRTRTKFISLAGALLRREGFRVRTGGPEGFGVRVSELPLPGRLRSEVAPLLAAMLALNREIAQLDGMVERLAQLDERVARLRSMPSVGPITATAFVAALDDPKRFMGAHQVEAFLGLVPREMSSGEKQRKGRITKVGDSRVRWLLVQAAQSMMRVQSPRTAELRRWAETIAARRGKKIAVVALARKMAGILYAMLRDGTVYKSKGANRSQIVAA